MEMQQIRHFVAIARHGSFRRAAQELHITQPALTRSIRHLEERLQSALFTRTARGVVPTPAGAVFLEFAQQTLHENARILNRLKQLQGAAPGELRIGVSANFSHPALAQTIAELISTVPERRVTIWEEFMTELVPKLAQSQIDLLVTLVPDGFSHPDLAVAPLVTVAGRVVCGCQHPLASQRTITLDDLSAVPWLMAGLEENERYLERRFAAHGAHAPRLAVRTNSKVLLKQLLLHTALVALVPVHLVTDELETGQFKVLETPLGEFLSHGAVVYQKRLGGLLDIDRFVARFRAAYESLSPEVPRPFKAAVRARVRGGSVAARRVSPASSPP